MLPKHLEGAYYCFNTALLREYGIKVSKRKYLKLLARAKQLEHIPYKDDHRTRVVLHFDQCLVPGIWEPTGGGALIGVVPLRLKR